MKTTLQGISAAALLLGMFNPASAAVIDQTVTAPSAEVDVNTTFGSTGLFTQTNGSFTFNAFDTSIGTLTGVSLSRAVTLTFSGTLTNTTQTSQTFFYGDIARIQISGQPGTLSSDDFGLQPDNFTSYTFAAQASATLPLSTFSPPTTKHYDSSGNFATYESGTIPFNIITTDSTNVQEGPPYAFFNGIQQQLTITGAGSYTLEYTYTPNDAPVPEPASILVLGAGLLGLALKRARQQSRA